MNNQQSQIPIFELYQDLWYIPFWRRAWFVVIFSIIVIVCILLIVYILYCMYKKRRMKIKSPEQRALMHLNELIVEVFIEKGKYDAFYAQVIAILKNYFTEIFDDIFYAKTDDEFLTSIQNLSLTFEQKEMIEDILRGIEYIKFAKKDVSSERMKDDLAKAIAVITNIKSGLEKRRT